ncbi:MAG: S-adenosyl-l-methionine hydroxide adenosyltransferase family protein [Syntrophobacteraceae bacterium]
MSHPIITLLTDFGLQDGYVASMKGVILSICPQATLVDITHEISPRDIQSAAFVLHTVAPSFPPGTIHVVVVDPGVGTERKAIAVQTPDCTLVGPDNGVFSRVLRTASPLQARSLENVRFQRSPVCPTFHGRDIFAPVAAHLAAGLALEHLGPSCTPIVAEWTVPKLEGGALLGEVIHIDRFGNAVTNIATKDLKRFSPQLEDVHVRAKDQDIGPPCRTYGDRQPGSLLALIGSSDHLEIAVNMGHCARILGLKINDPVSVTRDKR